MSVLIAVGGVIILVQRKAAVRSRIDIQVQNLRILFRIDTVYAELTPLILPMYYAYPKQREAYQVPNQYLFGSEMMAAAVTTPCLKGLNMAKTAVW